MNKYPSITGTAVDRATAIFKHFGLDRTKYFISGNGDYIKSRESANCWRLWVHPLPSEDRDRIGLQLKPALAIKEITDRVINLLEENGFQEGDGSGTEYYKEVHYEDGDSSNLHELSVIKAELDDLIKIIETY